MAKNAVSKLPPSPRPKKVDKAAPRAPAKAAKVAPAPTPTTTAARPVVARTGGAKSAPATTPKAQQAPTPPENDGTYSWHNLQEVLRDVTKSSEVIEMMNAEKAGRCRLRWLVRMQGRLQVLRNDEELTEIESIAKE